MAFELASNTAYLSASEKGGFLYTYQKSINDTNDTVKRWPTYLFEDNKITPWSSCMDKW